MGSLERCQSFQRRWPLDGASGCHVVLWWEQSSLLRERSANFDNRVGKFVARLRSTSILTMEPASSSHNRQQIANHVNIHVEVASGSINDQVGELHQCQCEVGKLGSRLTTNQPPTLGGHPGAAAHHAINLASAGCALKWLRCDA